MDSPVVSVIIPVYNSEKFIRRCVDSIVAQSHILWEAVFVDDGSTDSSASLLDNYAAADSRIKVIHKKNGGVSEARNDGVALARGKYVAFVDSDDFLHPDTFEICVGLLEREHADLIAFTYDRKYRRNTIIRHILHLPESKKVDFRRFDVASLNFLVTDDLYRYATELSRPQFPTDVMPWAVKHCQPWRCIYRREVVEDIRFIPGIMYEDFPWWGQVLLNVKKSVILNLPLYFYYPNRRSYIMSSGQAFRIESLRRAIEVSEETYLAEGSEYQRQMWNANFIVPFKKKLSDKIKRYGA